MKRLLAAFTIALLGWALAGTASASTVSASQANCRAAARANATVLGTLNRGQSVPVLSTSGDWSYVDPANLPACYIKSALLTDDGRVIGQSDWSRPVHYASPRASSRGSRYRAHAARLSSASSSRGGSSGGSRRSRSGSASYGYGAGSCPCSGSNICVGPRGGRYCITSGGNKRYGL